MIKIAKYASYAVSNVRLIASANDASMTSYQNHCLKKCVDSTQ